MYGQFAFFVAYFFLPKILSRVKTGEEEMDCYSKLGHRWLLSTSSVDRGGRL